MKIMVMLTKLLGIQPDGDDDKSTVDKKEEKSSTEKIAEVDLSSKKPTDDGGAITKGEKEESSMKQTIIIVSSKKEEHMMKLQGGPVDEGCQSVKRESLTVEGAEPTRRMKQHAQQRGLNVESEGCNRSWKSFGIRLRGRRMKIKQTAVKQKTHKKDEIITGVRSLQDPKPLLRDRLMNFAQAEEKDWTNKTNETLRYGISRSGGSFGGFGLQISGKTNLISGISIQSGYEISERVWVKGRDESGLGRGGINGPGLNFKSEPPDVILFQGIAGLQD